MVVVRPLHEVVGLLPVLVAVVLFGRGDPKELWWGGGAVVLLLLRGLVVWWRTSYRVGGELVELHTGLLGRRERALRRDRVRTVERTARFGHRIFGLAEVHIGTGQQQDRLRLDGLTAQEAERLRAELLRRPAGADEPDPVAAGGEGDVLATLDWRWSRFAPLTLSGIASVLIGLGAVVRVLNEVGRGGSVYTAIARQLGAWASRHSLVVDAVTALAAVVLVVLVVSLAGYALSWGGYQLTRRERTLRVQRGLLTTRAITIEEARLRGLRMREELLLRPARGARLTAITTGLGRHSRGGFLVPPAPVGEVQRVSAAIAGEAKSPTARSLNRHPLVALRRRVVRAAGAVLVLAAVAAALRLWAGWPDWPWIAALCLVVPAALLGLDRYRALGHALDRTWLVSRSGSVRRDTDALRRDGVIGWRLHRSFFQRRCGLLTLEPTTAAPHEHPKVVDIGEQDGIRLAEDAVPGLLGHLVVRDRA
jgi:putative membrane protein